MRDAAENVVRQALLQAEQEGFERGYQAGQDVTGGKTFEDGIREAAEIVIKEREKDEKIRELLAEVKEWVCEE